MPIAKMYKFTHSIAVLTLGLAACGNLAEEADDPKPTATETMMPVEPDGGIGDGTELSYEMTRDIPSKYHGVWDYEKGSCAPESDLRVAISSEAIQFYESYGKVSSVYSDSDEALVNVAMEGEGEQWGQVLRLSISDDGQNLSLTDATEPDAVDEYPRKRCPS